MNTSFDYQKEISRLVDIITELQKQIKNLKAYNRNRIEKECPHCGFGDLHYMPTDYGNHVVTRYICAICKHAFSVTNKKTTRPCCG